MRKPTKNRCEFLATVGAAGDGEAQARDVFAQLQSILAETGSDMLHLAKATYYVSDDSKPA